MKIKFNPVLYIFLLYICLSSYLIFSSFSFQQYLSGVAVVNLTPVAYGLLALGSILLTLSLFSLFRIPVFHYLFKMLHLWIVILSCLILFLYYKYGHTLSDIINANMQQKIAEIFPGTQAAMFKPPINSIQIALKNFKEHVVVLFLVVTSIMAVIQIILYMPSSLRHVYYTHVSPLKYTLKHITVSLLVLAPLLFFSILYFKSDSSLNPKLEKLLSTDQHKANKSDNAFYPMLTMWIPGITNRISYGEQWLSEHGKMLAYFQLSDKPVVLSQYPNYQKLLLGGMPQADQDAINQLYINRLLKDDIKIDTQIASYIKKYQQQLKISRSLYNYKYYQSPVNYTGRSYTDFYSDYSGSFLSLLRLNLLTSLIEYGSDMHSFIKNMHDEYYTNLRTIQYSDDPDVKNLYLDKQKVIVQFIYYVLQNPKFQNNDIYRFIDHIPVLGKSVISQKFIAQKNIQHVKNQLDQANKNLSKIRSATTKIIDYTYKYNQTLNCVFEHATNEYNLDNQGIEEYIKRQTPDTSKARVDNVIGNIICKSSLPEKGTDIYIKAVEINGSIMILKARSKLFENKINIINFGAFLTNHSRTYYNPFTAGPLKWDRDANQIYFKYNNGNKIVKVSY